MPASTTDIYRSSNGDRWQLVGASHPARMLVRHIPNASSGGQTTDVTVADFLRVDGPGPEYAALRRHLANIADHPPDA